MSTPILNTHGTWQSPEGFPLLEVNWSGQLGEDNQTPVGVETRPTGFDSPAPLNQGERVAYEYELQRWHMDEATAKRGVSGDAIFQPAQPILDTDSDVEKQAKCEANVRNAWDLATYDRVLASGRYETKPVITPVITPVIVATPPAPEVAQPTNAKVLTYDTPSDTRTPISAVIRTIADSPPPAALIPQSAVPTPILISHNSPIDVQAQTVVGLASHAASSLSTTLAALPPDHPHRSTLFALLGHLGSLLKVAAPIAAELVAANNPKYAGALAAVEAVQSTNPPTP